MLSIRYGKIAYRAVGCRSIIFIWFGILKPLGYSSAEGLLKSTVAWQSGNILLPTLEGQYIIKNLIIISAALVLGGEVSASRSSQEVKAS